MTRRAAVLTVSLTSLLVTSAGCRATAPGDGKVVAPEPGGASAAASDAPTPEHEDVAFAWGSRDGLSGAIDTVLPDGEAFVGKFYEVVVTDQTDHDDTSDDLLAAYRSFEDDGWDDPKWQWHGMFPRIDTVDDFVTAYTGKIVANLDGDKGTRMRCHFTLEDAGAGMEEGANGQCQLSDGARITARLNPK